MRICKWNEMVTGKSIHDRISAVGNKKVTQFQLMPISLIEFQLPLHVGWIDFKNRHVEYWAIRLSARSFARTAHSSACSALLASLARSAALIRSLARSLTHSGAHEKVVFVHETNASIPCSFGPLCIGPSVRRSGRLLCLLIYPLTEMFHIT